jgi:hypothetical protein
MRAAAAISSGLPGCAPLGSWYRKFGLGAARGKPRRLLLRTGRTDGRYTEVLSDELEEGDEVLVGVLSGKDGVQVGS